MDFKPTRPASRLASALAGCPDPKACNMNWKGDVCWQSQMDECRRPGAVWSGVGCGSSGFVAGNYYLGAADGCLRRDEERGKWGLTQALRLRFIYVYIYIYISILVN